MSVWSLFSTSWLRSQRYLRPHARPRRDIYHNRLSIYHRSSLLEELEDRTLLAGSVYDYSETVFQSTIYSDFTSITSLLDINSFAVANAGASNIIVQAPGGVTFNLITDPGMDQQAIDGFVEAALIWSSIFSDDVTVNIDIGFEALSPGVLGQAGSTSIATNYANFYGALDGDRTSDDDDAAVGSLTVGNSFDMLLNHVTSSPETNLAIPFVDDDGDANNSTIDINTATAKAIGLVAADDTRVDAEITFSNLFTWDFDRSDGIDSNAFDFVFVAAHEIGHALGFVSGVDVLDFFFDSFPDEEFVFVSPLDLFRYSSQSAAVGTGIIDWTADTRDKYFSLDNGQTKLASFSTGTFLGDGWQASHWKDDLGIGLMDPTAAPGELGMITSLDLQAFDVIGWDINQPPTLTTIDVLTGAIEDTPFSITYETLAAAADEFDPEGTEISFLVDSILNGTLTKNGIAVTPGTTTLSAGESMVWTPGLNDNGDTLPAFRVRAQDISGATSLPATVRIDVAAVNDAPTADAGGPYVVGLQDKIRLDGSGSFDPEQSSRSLTYLWDYNGDGNYDALGMNPDFTMADLQGKASVLVTLKVMDDEGLVDTDTARVYAEDLSQFEITGDSNGVVGQRRTLTLNLFNSPTGQDGYKYTVDWGDGSAPEVHVGPPGILVNNTFYETGTFSVHVTVTNADTGYFAEDSHIIRIGTSQQQGSDFAVSGTSGHDDFRIVTQAGVNRVEVMRNNVSLGVYTVPGTVLVFGLSGDDTLRSDDGTYNVMFDGGRGNNTSYTYGGNDTIYGRDGDDRIYDDGGNNYINAGDGDNVIQTGVGNDVIMSGNGNDRITDTGGDNEIFAGNGDNDINTRRGNDLIITGFGHDQVNDIGGNNWIEVGDGSNVVHGGDGSDTILGGNQDDHIYTAADIAGGYNFIATFGGNDFIYAGGLNLIDSGPGDDFIFASNILDDEDDLFDLLARWR